MAKASKVEFYDECYAPRRSVWVEYSGPDPFAFVRAGRGVLRSVFEVGTSSTGEPRFMWDWTGDPIQLYIHWIVNKSYSRFTKFWVSIRVVGFKSKSKNEGSFRMEVEPVLKHTISGSRLTIWLWWIYWYLFYTRVRNSMIERCKGMADSFIAVIKEMYNLGQIKEE